MTTIYAVAEHCPLGCGPVVLVKRLTDGHVFAWCTTCGIAWEDPAKEKWQPGDSGGAELHAAMVANGSFIEHANENDVERAGLKDYVVIKLPADEWRLGSVAA